MKRCWLIVLLILRKQSLDHINISEIILFLLNDVGFRKNETWQGHN